MSPKENKDKQIDQNAQKNLTKCDADCSSNIFKNNDIFEKVRKRKVFILKEKDAGLAIKSMSIDSSFILKKKTIQWNSKANAQKFDFWSKAYFYYM